MIQFVPKNVIEIISLEQNSIKACDVEEDTLLSGSSESEWHSQ
jgi:hypothetical protein